MTLPISVILSFIFAFVNVVRYLSKCTKTCVKSHKITYEMPKIRLLLKLRRFSRPHSRLESGKPIPLSPLDAFDVSKSLSSQSTTYVLVGLLTKEDIFTSATIRHDASANTAIAEVRFCAKHCDILIKIAMNISTKFIYLYFMVVKIFFSKSR